MKKINFDELQWFEEIITDFICDYPDSVSVWVQRLVKVVEVRTTTENMGILDPIEIQDKDQVLFDEWFEDLKIECSPYTWQPEDENYYGSRSN